MGQRKLLCLLFSSLFLYTSVAAPYAQSFTAPNPLTDRLEPLKKLYLKNLRAQRGVDPEQAKRIKKFVQKKLFLSGPFNKKDKILVYYCAQKKNAPALCIFEFTKKEDIVNKSEFLNIGDYMLRNMPGTDNLETIISFQFLAALLLVPSNYKLSRITPYAELDKSQKPKDPLISPGLIPSWRNFFNNHDYRQLVAENSVFQSLIMGLVPFILDLLQINLGAAFILSWLGASGALSTALFVFAHPQVFKPDTKGEYRLFGQKYKLVKAQGSDRAALSVLGITMSALYALTYMFIPHAGVLETLGVYAGSLAPAIAFHLLWNRFIAVKLRLALGMMNRVPYHRKLTRPYWGLSLFRMFVPVFSLPPRYFNHYTLSPSLRYIPYLRSGPNQLLIPKGRLTTHALFSSSEIGNSNYEEQRLLDSYPKLKHSSLSWTKKQMGTLLQLEKALGKSKKLLFLPILQYFGEDILKLENQLPMEFKDLPIFSRISDNEDNAKPAIWPIMDISRKKGKTLAEMLQILTVLYLDEISFFRGYQDRATTSLHLVLDTYWPLSREVRARFILDALQNTSSSMLKSIMIEEARALKLVPSQVVEYCVKNNLREIISLYADNSLSYGEKSNIHPFPMMKFSEYPYETKWQSPAYKIPEFFYRSNYIPYSLAILQNTLLTLFPEITLGQTLELLAQERMKVYEKNGVSMIGPLTMAVFNDAYRGDTIENRPHEYMTLSAHLAFNYSYYLRSPNYYKDMPLESIFTQYDLAKIPRIFRIADTNENLAFMIQIPGNTNDKYIPLPNQYKKRSVKIAGKFTEKPIAFFIQIMLEWQIKEKLAQKMILQLLHKLVKGELTQVQIPWAVEILRKQIQVLENETNLIPSYFEMIYGSLKQILQEQDLQNNLREAYQHNKSNRTRLSTLLPLGFNYNQDLLTYLENIDEAIAGTHEDIELDEIVPPTNPIPDEETNSYAQKTFDDYQ